MATRATFLADFSKFDQAVRQSETQLKSFQSGAVQVEKALARVGDSFSGRRLIQEATLTAKAIEDIGGVTKLTGSELQRAGDLAKAAAEKLRALGEDVPPKIQALAKAAEQIPEKLTLAARAADLAKSSFGQMFGALSAANLVSNAVTSLVGFGKAAFESASKTADMSAKLGISTEAIQRMDFVASQTGSTVEDFASSAFKLGVRLSGGSNSVSAAVKELGLNFAQLRSAKPEQQFETVVGALGKMQDATKRNELGVALFGKAFEQIAAGVAANYGELAKQAAVSSDAQIQALDRAGDAWDRFYKRQSTNVRGILGNLVDLVERRGALMAFIDLASPFGPGLSESARLRQGTEDAKHRLDALDQAGAKGFGFNFDSAQFVKELAAAEEAVKKLRTEHGAELDAAIKLGKKQEDLADKYGVSEETIRLYTSAVKESASETESLFGRDVLAKAVEYARTIGNVSNVTKLSKEKQAEVNKVVTEAIDIYERMHKSAPQALVDLKKATDDLGESTKEYRKVLSDARNEQGKFLMDFDAMILNSSRSDATKKLQQQLMLTVAPQIGPPRLSQNLTANNRLQDLLFQAVVPGDDFMKKANQHISETVRGVFAGTGRLLQSELASTILDALKGGGSVTRSVGGLVGGGLFRDLAGKLSDEAGKSGIFTSGIGKVLQKTLGKTIGGALGSVIPGIGTLLGSFAGPLLGKIGGFFKSLFGGPSQRELEGRQQAAAFRKGLEDGLTAAQRAEAAGVDGILRGSERWKLSVIAIRDAYVATGRTEAEALAIGERLWRAEREGVDAVKRVMDDINAVLEEQRLDSERLQKAIEKYGFTLEQLGPAFRRQQLSDQAKDLIEDWRVLVNSGINVSTVNEKMAQTFNDYLKSALAVGGEVPAALKPILQSLATQGVLVDANGKKITDINKSGLTFSETMSEGFDRVVQKLQELIDRLQLAGVAIEDLPKNVLVDVQTRSNMAARLREIQEYYDYLTSHGVFQTHVPKSAIDPLIDALVADPTKPIPKFHSGGLVRQWRTAHEGLYLKPDEVPIIAQTGERILSRDETRAYNQTGSGDFHFHGNVVIQGEHKNARQLAEELVRELPDAWRKGWGRNAARTALGVA